MPLEMIFDAVAKYKEPVTCCMGSKVCINCVKSSINAALISKVSEMKLSMTVIVPAVGDSLPSVSRSVPVIIVNVTLL